MRSNAIRLANTPGIRRQADRRWTVAPDFLERRECVVRIQADTLEINLPRELDAEQARLELDLYLRVWQALPHWTSVEYVRTP
jgi:hypothetical protein